MSASVALLAYLIDRLFGEFSFIKHPVVMMGAYISWFQKHFYAPTLLRGMLLTLSLVCLVGVIAWGVEQSIVSLFPSLVSIVLLGVIASTTIASHMLYHAVEELLREPHKIAYLVSRDTQNLSDEEIYKAGIETYAENLSDGVIAPLFYLLLFGITGAFVYKAINTLDSMVGYKNEQFEQFGKASAKLDDIANFIPSRLTALLILLLHKKLSLKNLSSCAKMAKGHESPNAGYPITAMGMVLGVRLGGDTSYFGEIKHKPYFGEGEREIDAEALKEALSLYPLLNTTLSLLLALGVLLS